MSVAVSDQQLNHPRSLAAFRGCKLLLGTYLTISVLTLVAIALLRHHADVVNAAVWVRGTIVAVSSLVTCLLGNRAARGSRGAYRRLRILTGVMVVAIAVIIALPGTFPLWLKLEQGVCGLILIGVVVIVNGRHLRELFTSR